MNSKDAGKPGQSWVTFVHKNGSPEFAAKFASDASLEASVLVGSLVGAEAIGRFFSATTGMYDSIAFLRELSDGEVTILEWAGNTFGEKVGGLTLVARDAAGLIRSIRIYHHPLPVLIRFSEELHKRLGAASRG